MLRLPKEVRAGENRVSEDGKGDVFRSKDPLNAEQMTKEDPYPEISL